jgi:hypothetical protein
LRVSGLRKRYGATQALDGMTFTVEVAAPGQQLPADDLPPRLVTGLNSARTHRDTRGSRDQSSCGSAATSCG